jgi:protein TonB
MEVTGRRQLARQRGREGDMTRPATLETFDALLDEARQGGRLRPPAARPAVPSGPRPEPILEFGSFLADETGPVVRRRRGVAVPASMLLHAAGAMALVVLPLLVAESLPTAATGVRAFFVEPITAPPPPPPPPPAPRGAAAASVAPRAEVKTPGFTAPIEVPTEIVPDEEIDFGGPGGVPGGVEGGVPGGVVGGIVTGLPEAPAPPAPVRAVRVGGDVREPRKIVNVPPVYPEVALRARLEGGVIVEATLDERGRVRDATVLRGLPVLDEAALEAVRQWVYTPTLLDGVPTPVILTVTVRFQLKGAAR